MSRCPGLHCEGCGKSKVVLSAGGVAALLGGIYYATHKQAVDHAADDLLEWLLITLIVLVVAGVVTAATVVAVKLRARQRRMATATAIAPPHVIIMHAKAAPAAIAGPARITTAALPPAPSQSYQHLNGYPQAAAYAPLRHRPRCTAVRNPGGRR